MIPLGMSWDSSGILFAKESGPIFRISPDGGKPEVLVAPQNDEMLGYPQLLPGGRAVLFTVRHETDWDHASVVVQMLKSGERKTVLQAGTGARYLPTGHLVYAQGGVLYAAPFDVRRLQMTKAAVPVLDGVQRAAFTGVAHFDVSSTGSLVFVPGPAVPLNSRRSLLVFVDPDGNVERLKLPPAEYRFPRVTRDGKRLAYQVNDGPNSAIWVYDLSQTNAPKRLTFEGSNRYPVWSPDGERIAFQSDREADLGIFWQRADGSGTAERLTKPENDVAHVPASLQMAGISPPVR
jgi:serine/threonine-protein kinase